MHVQSSFSGEEMFHSSQQHLQAGNVALACAHALFGMHLLSHCEPTEAQRQTTEQLLANLPTLRHYQHLIHTAKTHALAARQRAYAPYSEFLVGATLLATDGTLWSGCNIESSSYGLTLCAERTALGAAVAQGKRQFAAVVVATAATPPSSPCGACRQLLYEFAPDAIALCINANGEEWWTTMRALLPKAFALHPPNNEHPRSPLRT